MFYRASSTRGQLQKISLLEQNIIEGAHAERAGFQRRADVGQVCTMARRRSAISVVRGWRKARIVRFTGR